MMPKECILIGGGKSIEPYRKELVEKLKDRFCITINYSFLHFPHTFTVFGDHDFYTPLQAKNTPHSHPDIYEELKKESLIIYANDKNKLKQWQLPNTIFIKTGTEYNIDPLRMGFYCHFLSGIYTLSLAQFLLNYSGRIFLLGYDFGALDKKTKDIHYYTKEEINHKGVNLVTPYNHNNVRYFNHFKEPNIKIFNVSPQSNIQNFEKVDYPTMFTLLSEVRYEQEKLRKYIKEKLK